MSASPCPERGIIILSTVSCYQTKVSSNSGQSLSHLAVWGAFKY